MSKYFTLITHLFINISGHENVWCFVGCWILTCLWSLMQSRCFIQPMRKGLNSNENKSVKRDEKMVITAVRSLWSLKPVERWEYGQFGSCFWIRKWIKYMVAFDMCWSVVTVTSDVCIDLYTFVTNWLIDSIIIKHEPLTLTEFGCFPNNCHYAKQDR
jgi:hypothetical protein